MKVAIAQINPIIADIEGNKKKILDYIKKCNDHKHKKEKYLGVESIVNYLRIYYNLINYYIDLYLMNHHRGRSLDMVW